LPTHFPSSLGDNIASWHSIVRQIYTQPETTTNEHKKRNKHETKKLQAEREKESEPQKKRKKKITFKQRQNFYVFFLPSSQAGQRDIRVIHTLVTMYMHNIYTYKFFVHTHMHRIIYFSVLQQTNSSSRQTWLFTTIAGLTQSDLLSLASLLVWVLRLRFTYVFL